MPTPSAIIQSVFEALDSVPATIDFSTIAPADLAEFARDLYLNRDLRTQRLHEHNTMCYLAISLHIWQAKQTLLVDGDNIPNIVKHSRNALLASLSNASEPFDAIWSDDLFDVYFDHLSANITNDPDSWYQRTVTEDPVLAIAGRTRRADTAIHWLKTDGRASCIAYIMKHIHYQLTPRSLEALGSRLSRDAVEQSIHVSGIRVTITYLDVHEAGLCIGQRFEDEFTEMLLWKRLPADSRERVIDNLENRYAASRYSWHFGGSWPSSRFATSRLLVTPFPPPDATTLIVQGHIPSLGRESDSGGMPYSFDLNLVPRV